MLEKAKCEHMKSMSQPDFKVSLGNIKKPPIWEINSLQKFGVLEGKMAHKATTKNAEKVFT
jgi:hypothetical protein